MQDCLVLAPHRPRPLTEVQVEDAMKVALVTPWRTDDPSAWSGVIAPMRKALEGRVDVAVIETGAVTHSIVDRALAKIIGATSATRYPANLGLASSVKRARYVQEEILKSGAEVVLGLVASQDLAFANLTAPVVQVTDATFDAISNYYPGYSGLHAVARFQGHIVERQSQRNSRAFVVATEWARQAVLAHPHLHAEAVTVAPFGPAIVPDRTREVFPGGPLRVLLVSSDWQRKGGERALEVVGRLREKAADVSLTVVGDAPSLPEWVNYLGLVERRDMPEIFAQHDVLLELAAANAGGVTLTDAHAFGLPCIATDTGGVSSIVDHGRSGILIDPDQPIEPAAVEALEMLMHKSRWAEFSSGALDRHARVLNWDVWADRTIRVCHQVVEAGGLKSGGGEN